MTQSYIFTDQQIADIRRYAGYPAYGANSNGFYSVRYFQSDGVFEFRIQNLSEIQGTTLITSYLTPLYALESAYLAAGANLDTDEASVWKHNKTEVQERKSLYYDYRRQLCFYLDIDPGESLSSPGWRKVL